MLTHLNILHRLSLKPQCKQYRALKRTQLHLLAQALLEVPPRDRREQVKDDVVVEHIIGVGVETFDVEGGEEEGEFRG